jgi:hypothetical protein
MSSSNIVTSNGNQMFTKREVKTHVGLTKNSPLMSFILEMMSTSKFGMMIESKMILSEMVFPRLALSALAKVLMNGLKFNGKESQPVKSILNRPGYLI